MNVDGARKYVCFCWETEQKKKLRAPESWLSVKWAKRGGERK